MRVFWSIVACLLSIVLVFFIGFQTGSIHGRHKVEAEVAPLMESLVDDASQALNGLSRRLQQCEERKGVRL